MPKIIKNLPNFLAKLEYIKQSAKHKPPVKNGYYKALNELFFELASKGDFIQIQENAKIIYDYVKMNKNK